MIEERLERILGRLEPPPESPEKILRSQQEIMAGLAERGLVDHSSDSQSRTRRRSAAAPRRPVLRWAFVIAILAAVLSLAATPTGEAVARWVGGIFGIGEPGGTPSLDSGTAPQRRDPSAADAGAEDVRPIVLATGRVSGFRVELSSSQSAGQNLCLNVDLPEINFNTIVCPDHSKPGKTASGRARAPVVDSLTTAVPGLDGGALLAGLSPPDTTAVQVYLDPHTRSERDRAIAAVVADPDAAIRAKAGLDQTAVYFAAVIPRNSGRGLAVALDSDGASLGSQRFQLNTDGGSLRPDVYAD